MPESEMKELGQALRRHRERAGLYQFQVGQRLGYGERTVQRAENGQLSAPYLKRWLAAYEHSEPELAAQVGEGLRHYQEHQQAVPLAWWPPEWGTLAETVPPEHDEDDPMKRRAVLAAGLALPAGAALEAGQERTVRDYEHVSEALRRAYSRTPARLLLPQVTATLATLEHDLAAAGETARRYLLVPYAELHLLAGWAARWDLMDGTAAATHTRLAAHAARHAGDADLLAHTLALHSYLCRWGDRTDLLPEAVQAAEEACRLVPVSRPASVSYVNVVAAEATADTGDEARTLEHLDAARSAAAAAKPGSLWRGPGTVWNPRRMTAYEAYTLRAVGRPAEAYAVFRSAQRQAPQPGNDLYGHSGGVWALNLAETLFALNEIEAAATQATHAHQLAQRRQHANLLIRTRKLYVKLSAHDAVPAVRELGEALRA